RTRERRARCWARRSWSPGLCRASGPSLLVLGARGHLAERGRARLAARPLHERRQGAAAVADAALLLQAGLGEALAELGAVEHRVVAEAAGAARALEDDALALAAEGAHGAAGRGHDDHRHELGGARLAVDLLELLQQVRHALAVVQAGATVAGRVHAGLAAERGDLQAGVVGQGGDARLER